MDTCVVCELVVCSWLHATKNVPLIQKTNGRLANAMEKADNVVKPYVKSLSGVTLSDIPVFKRLLAIVQRVAPTRILGLLKLQKRGETTEGKAVPVQVTPKRQAVRSAPPPTRLGATPPKALPKPPGALETPRAEAGIAVPSEIEKAGQEVMNTVGDFFKNVGGSMDNLLVGEKQPPAPKQRGVIIA